MIRNRRVGGLLDAARADALELHRLGDDEVLVVGAARVDAGVGAGGTGVDDDEGRSRRPSRAPPGSRGPRLPAGCREARTACPGPPPHARAVARPEHVEGQAVDRPAVVVGADDVELVGPCAVVVGTETWISLSLQLVVGRTRLSSSVTAPEPPKPCPLDDEGFGTRDARVDIRLRDREQLRGGRVELAGDQVGLPAGPSTLYAHLGGGEVGGHDQAGEGLELRGDLPVLRTVVRVEVPRVPGSFRDEPVHVGANTRGSGS